MVQIPKKRFQIGPDKILGLGLFITLIWRCLGGFVHSASTDSLVPLGHLALIFKLRFADVLTRKARIIRAFLWIYISEYQALTVSLLKSTTVGVAMKMEL